MNVPLDWNVEWSQHCWYEAVTRLGSNLDSLQYIHTNLTLQPYEMVLENTFSACQLKWIEASCRLIFCKSVMSSRLTLFANENYLWSVSRTCTLSTTTVLRVPGWTRIPIYIAYAKWNRGDLECILFSLEALSTPASYQIPTCRKEAYMLLVFIWRILWSQVQVPAQWIVT